MRRIDHAERLTRAARAAFRKGTDALLITDEKNVRYACGFTGHDSIVLITRRKRYFLTDARYIEAAEEEVSGCELRLANNGLFAGILDIAKEARFKRLGFEGMGIEYQVAARLKEYLGTIRLVPTLGLLEELRTIKDAAEIALIRRSIALARRVLRRVLPMVRPGVREEALKREIEIAYIHGGGVAGFDPIIAANPRCSKPHARASAHRIRTGNFVMLDTGCTLSGYNSDMTRTVAVGKPPPRFHTIYGIVRKAQELAIKKIRPGTSIAAIDAAARDHITAAGYGDCFGHSLGHGIGLAVHEGPTVARRTDEPLRKGMVFTVEPAIYLPGFGGVRIEDMVLVTDDGCEVLTR